MEFFTFFLKSAKLNLNCFPEIQCFFYFIHHKINNLFAMSKIKKYSMTFMQEALTTAFGWISGLIASKIVSQYFAVRSMKNLWGLASNKEVVSKESMEIIQLVSSAIVGYIVLFAVSRISRSIFSRKNVKDEIEAETLTSK